MAALLSTDTASLAQAGSTGGTIGKTNKSASGGDEPQGDEKAGRRATTKQAGNGCDKVIGKWQWKWRDGTAVITVNANGTATASGNPFGATWTCTDRTLVLHFPWWSDTMVLSSDEKQPTGSNSNGVALSANRL
jgi:hypothetical protein